MSLNETQTVSVSLNARVAAVAIFAGSIALALLAFIEPVLAPLSLLTLGIITFGIWAFSDEMGIRKPLIRAGFVAFIFAVFAKSSALLQISSPDLARDYVLYSFALLIAVTLWSIAFLHRNRDLKVVGALGVFTAVAPIILLLVGHVIVGVGAAFGIAALFAATAESGAIRFAVVDNIEFLFSLWGIVASVMLWTGRIHD